MQKNSTQRLYKNQTKEDWAIVEEIYRKFFNNFIGNNLLFMLRFREEYQE
jgi:hypothetical protein